MNVSSQSPEPSTISFDEMYGFPEKYVQYTAPEPIILEPGASKKMVLELYIPSNETITPGSMEEIGKEIPVSLFLRTEKAYIGMGFYLKVVP